MTQAQAELQREIQTEACPKVLNSIYKLPHREKNGILTMCSLVKPNDGKIQEKLDSWCLYAHSYTAEPFV